MFVNIFNYFLVCGGGIQAWNYWIKALLISQTSEYSPKLFLCQARPVNREQGGG